MYRHRLYTRDCVYDCMPTYMHENKIKCKAWCWADQQVFYRPPCIIRSRSGWMPPAGGGGPWPGPPGGPGLPEGPMFGGGKGGKPPPGGPPGGPPPGGKGGRTNTALGGVVSCNTSVDTPGNPLGPGGPPMPPGGKGGIPGGPGGPPKPGGGMAPGGNWGRAALAWVLESVSRVRYSVNVPPPHAPGGGPPKPIGGPPKDGPEGPPRCCGPKPNPPGGGPPPLS
jgi:hypothetical protein